jgi:rubredoxin
MCEAAEMWCKCTGCGYLFQAPEPCESCAGCSTKCVLTDAACHTPECGGPALGKPDARVTVR